MVVYENLVSGSSSNVPLFVHDNDGKVFWSYTKNGKSSIGRLMDALAGALLATFPGVFEGPSFVLEKRLILVQDSNAHLESLKK